MTHRRAARIYGLLLLGFCAVATGLCGILTFVANPDPLANEKRRLARIEWPQNLDELSRFPQKFEAFFNDNFGFRTALIRLDGKVSLAFLGRSPSEKVIEGKHDWLFFSGEHSLELYQNALPLSASDLDVMRERIKGRRDRLAAKGIGYAFVVPPDKHTIYPENMPDRYRRREKPSQYDQLMTMARENDLPVVDLRPALRAGKALGPVYLRDDTHWNDFGAALALPEIFGAMKPTFDISAPPPKAEDFEAQKIPVGDLAEMALLDRHEIAPVLKDSALPCKIEIIDKHWDEAGRKFFTRAGCAGAKGKILFIHDSFGDYLVGPVSARFGETFSIWVRPTEEQFDNLVAAEKPDFVIEERAERALSGLP